VFPNPVVENAEVFVRIDENAGRRSNVSLTDMVGRVVNCKMDKTENVYRFDLQALNNGLYVATLTIDQRVYSRKIYLNLQR
jgi:hypothetical protein